MANAQTIQVTGTVISGDDNEPIIGASVVVKGTTIGTVTNLDGEFILDVPASEHELEVSYIGMKSQTVNVAPSIHEIGRASCRERVSSPV